MPDPPAADAVSQALSRLAADTQRQTAYYGNLRGLPGRSARPQRLLSETGFPNGLSFSYVVPATSLVSPHDPPRSVLSFALHPYGLDEDTARLTSGRPADRRVRTSGGPDTPGVRALSDNPGLYVSALLDSSTYAASKTTAVISNLSSSRRGPAYHFVISRRGDIIVGAVLDHETTASTSGGATTVDIALEGAFALARTDHEARSYDGKLIELPYTATQVLVLSILVVKLRTAYTAVPADLTAGIVYDWRGDSWRGATQYNFSLGAWRDGAAPFDYALSDTAFIQNLSSIPPFDLATQIFRLDQAPPPVATRAVAQTAINTSDSAGEQAILLANYGALAGPERAHAMQTAPRVQFFVERSNTAGRDATTTGGAAADTSAAGNRSPLVASTGTEPSTYDFTTGRWSDDDGTY